MKKISLFVLLLFLVSIVVYFNQDRDKLYIQNPKSGRYSFNEDNILRLVKDKYKTISYTVDANSLRLEKKINGTTVQKYFWQGREKLKLITDSKNNVLREYLYRNKYENLPYGMRVDDKLYFFIFNKLKSLKLVLDENNRIVKALDYDKRGVVTRDSNPLLQVDFSYAGGVLDKDAKLLFFAQGVYDPINQKWISKIKDIDIIKNIKNLNRLKQTKVFTCNATLDVYYHSFICTNGRCGGLYATDYLNYIDGLGYMIDNSYYFDAARCTELSLSHKHDKAIFSQCVYQRINSQKKKAFDAFRHNCHHEVKEIIKACKKRSKKGNYEV